jgi:glutamine amidotransferase-like uncharacterized protein
MYSAAKPIKASDISVIRVNVIIAEEWHQTTLTYVILEAVVCGW